MENKIVFENERSLIRLLAMLVLTFTVGIKKKIYAFFGVKPNINSFFFDGSSHNLREIKKYAASWKALEIIYKEPGYFTGVADLFFLRIRNAQAVRNRFKVIKNLLRNAIVEQDKSKIINVLSLACGSARAVLEVCSEMKSFGYNFNILLIDRDPEAVEYAKNLACQFGLEKQLEIIAGDVLKTKSYLRRTNFQPHVIEMLGFMDYLSDRAGKMVVAECFNAIPDGGYFLTCHVHPNEEQKFMDTVIEWEMLYRSRDELLSIVKSSPFSEFNSVTEPHNIHTVVSCRK